MVVGVVARQPRRDLVERQLGEHGHAVEGLLPVHRDIVAQRLNRLARKGIVDALGLLQADDVGLPLGQPGGEVINSLLYGIDVPSGDAHDRPGSGRRRSSARNALMRSRAGCDPGMAVLVRWLRNLKLDPCHRMRAHNGYGRSCGSQTKKIVMERG